MTMIVRAICFGVACLLASSLPAAEDLLENGGFEEGFAGWHRVWSRTGDGTGAIDRQQFHGGEIAMRVEHAGTKDWSFQRTQPIDVEPGQIYELSGWVRLQGEGSATLCVTLRGPEARVIDWAYGGRSNQRTDDWQLLKCRFVIPQNGRQMLPRLIGHGPSTVWFDDVSLRLVGDVARMRSADLPDSLSVANDVAEVTVHTATSSLTIVDRRTARRWQQQPAARLIVLDATRRDNAIDLRWLHPRSMLTGTGVIELVDDKPEIRVQLSADGQFDGQIAFPPPVKTEAGMTLIMPVNEGISYPFDDSTLPTMHYHLFGGHGLCMGWYGIVTGGDREGLMTVVETADDATVRVDRVDGRLTQGPQWLPNKGRFGYPRQLKYVLFDEGGYVAMCKYYRRQREQLGLVKTLAEKRQANGHVDLLGTGVTTTTNYPAYGIAATCSTRFTARRPCSCSIGSGGKRKKTVS